jgi:hypothetical protein
MDGWTSSRVDGDQLRSITYHAAAVKALKLIVIEMPS